MMYNQDTLLYRFKTYLTTERKASQHTVIAYTTDLMQFVAYLAGHTDQKLLTQVTTNHIRGWIVSLVKRGLDACSINRKIAAIRRFYTYLQAVHYIIDNPTCMISYLKSKNRLPIFFQEKALLHFLNYYAFNATFTGLRDQLILELLYGTGIRLSELLSLRVGDIHLISGTIHILGKRHKARVIPFPKPLKQIIRLYLSKRRALGYRATEALLITRQGRPCYPKLIYRVVKKYLSGNMQASRHSPHILRHSFATHLLNRGATLWIGAIHSDLTYFVTPEGSYCSRKRKQSIRREPFEIENFTIQFLKNAFEHNEYTYQANLLACLQVMDKKVVCC